MNGITRANIIRVCNENNVTCIEKDFSLFDVYSADEAFVTGTFGGVTPVTKIDGRVIGNGEFGFRSRELGRLYELLIHREVQTL